MSDRRRGAHLAPVLRTSPYAIYWWATILFSGSVLLVTAARLRPADLLVVDVAYWLLVGFVVLGELRPIVGSARTDPDGVNLGTAFVFAILLRWGLDLALVAVVVATLVGEAGRRKPVHAALFNVAQYTLSYLAAGLVLAALGWTAAPGAPAVLHPRDLGVVALSGAAYHLTNLAVVGTGIGLIERRSLLEAVTEGFRWYTVTTGSVVAIAPLVVVVIGQHWGFLPLLLLPLALLWMAAKMSLEREQRSSMDDLTGVANRARLAAHVQSLATAPQGEQGAAALCLIDLDRFKEVNDTFGHATGDQLLQTVAMRLSRACRDSDVVARLGGDEFAVLIGLRGDDDPEPVVERLAQHLLEPYEIAGARLELEVSAGIAMWPDEGGDLETLLRRADLAMYEAKERGETVGRYRPELERRAPSRLGLLSDLRRALDEGELVLHYQPQVRIDDGDVLGMEALVRWHHPSAGLLLPDEFLPLAERTSLMRRLTATVLDHALDQAGRWWKQGLGVPVAVNVSLHDLADARFAELVARGLERRSLPPATLRLEVTEQALVSDPARVLATLARLSEMGVALSLDDFGAGHASLTRLKRLPVTEVKIDRAFVVDLTGPSADDAAIVGTVIKLGRILGMRTVAEGVECHRQWDTLEALGCDAVQGWYVAPAMAEEQATDWLHGRLTAAQLASGGGDGALRVDN